MRLLVLLLAALSLLAQETFTNPLLPSGPDPWITFHNGFYYYMNTTGRNLIIWKTRSIAELLRAEKKVIWPPPPSALLPRYLGA